MARHGRRELAGQPHQRATPHRCRREGSTLRSVGHRTPEGGTTLPSRPTGIGRGDVLGGDEAGDHGPELSKKQVPVELWGYEGTMNRIVLTFLLPALVMLGAVGIAAPASAASASCAGLTKVGGRLVAGPGGKTVGSIKVFQNRARNRWCVESRRLNRFADTAGTTTTILQSTSTKTLSPSPFKPKIFASSARKNLFVNTFPAAKTSAGKKRKCLYFGLNVQRGTGTTYGAANATCFR